MTTLTATSPDGRTWEVGSTRERVSFWENKNEPFFWAGVITTAILVVGTIVLAFFSTIVAILAGILLVIWLAERASNLLRPRLYARTEGPTSGGGRVEGEPLLAWEAGAQDRRGDRARKP